MNPSPLRYPGGKYKLKKYIKELVELNNCSTYIEPFCGGAALGLSLLFDNVVKKIIINDFDYTIYCFWRSVVEYTEDFIEKIEVTDVNVEEWRHQKEIREQVDNYDLLDIGFSTFFLNRTNRSGIIDKAGPIGGIEQNGNYSIDCRFNKDRLIEEIRKIGEYRDNIMIFNMEALDFVDNVICNTRKSFTFFDPPYYNKGEGLYTSTYNNGDHANLALYVKEKMKRRKWIVTYDNVTAIKNMYSWAEYIEFELQYSLQEKRKDSEVMFFSKNVSRPQNEDECLKVLRRG